MLKSGLSHSLSGNPPAGTSSKFKMLVLQVVILFTICGCTKVSQEGHIV